MRVKSWITPGLMVVVLSVFLLLPPLEPLTTVGMKVVGIFLFTIIGWIFLGIGYPSILCSTFGADRGYDTRGSICCLLG